MFQAASDSFACLRPRSERGEAPGTMSGNGPHTEAPMYFEVEVDPLDREDEEEDDKIRFDKDNDLMPQSPSSSGRVYDRTTVLIERDPIRLDEEGEEEGHCGGDEDGVTFLTECEGDGDEEEGTITFMTDPDNMLQGYVHHTISPDQIQFTINPGSTPMPRNIEGATLTLHSECPETKQREASTLSPHPQMLNMLNGFRALHCCDSDSGGARVSTVTLQREGGVGVGGLSLLHPRTAGTDSSTLATQRW